jgi:hypothetical protein
MLTVWTVWRFVLGFHCDSHSDPHFWEINLFDRDNRQNWPFRILANTWKFECDIPVCHLSKKNTFSGQIIPTNVLILDFPGTPLVFRNWIERMGQINRNNGESFLEWVIWLRLLVKIHRETEIGKDRIDRIIQALQKLPRIAHSLSHFNREIQTRSAS